jgi:hypothetical protein
MVADTKLDRNLQIRRDVDKALCVHQYICMKIREKENNSVYAAKIFRKTIIFSSVQA